jgi:hypothetical protein
MSFVSCLWKQISLQEKFWKRFLNDKNQILKDASAKKVFQMYPSSRREEYLDVDLRGQKYLQARLRGVFDMSAYINSDANLRSGLKEACAIFNTSNSQDASKTNREFFLLAMQQKRSLLQTQNESSQISNS